MNSGGRKRSAVVFRYFDVPARARAALVLVTSAGLLLTALTSAPTRLLGLHDAQFWFLDSYAVLASTDAYYAGLNVEQPNPLDVLHRPHAYTDWWFALHKLGLTRHDNFLLGATWVLAFAVVAWLTLRPRNGIEALVGIVAMLSPPVLLAVNRANNDLVIFAVLGLGAMALTAAKPWSWPLALLTIAVATGLKIYPVVGAAVFLLLRPRRRMLIVSGAAAVVLLAVLHDVWPALHRAPVDVPKTLFTFGAPILLQSLGFEGKAPLAAAAVLLGLVATALVRTGKTAGLAETTKDFGPRVLFALGSALLVGCFFAGISFGYRCIFILWLVPWLAAQSKDESTSARHVARFTLGLTLAVLWLDGLYCAVLDTFVRQITLPELRQWIHLWQLTSQPFSWLLIALLTGWLLDATIAALQASRPAKAAAS